MTKDSPIEKSLIDQIVEKTLTNLNSLDEFDPDTIKLLFQLFENGDLKTPDLVADAIKPA